MIVWNHEARSSRNREEGEEEFHDCKGSRMNESEEIAED